MRAKLFQSCLTLFDLTNCSPPGSSVHGILQTRILEWVATPSSKGSFQLGDQTHVSWNGRQILYYRTTWEAPFRRSRRNQNAVFIQNIVGSGSRKSHIQITPNKHHHGLPGSWSVTRKLLASSFSYFPLTIWLTPLLYRKLGVFIVYNSLNTQFSLLGSLYTWTFSLNITSSKDNIGEK